MPIASAPYALPWAISLRSRLVPSCAAAILTHPRASSTVTTSGFSFFSTALASAESRILRATSRVSSDMHDSFARREGLGLRLSGVEAHGQHARDVKGRTAGTIGNLMTARGAIGDDHRGFIGGPHRGEQRAFGHVDRALMGLGGGAEGPRRAAAN